MPFLIAILVKRGMSAQMAKVAILVAAALIIVGGIWLAIALHDRRVITEYEADATGHLIVKNADATVEAAERRVKDSAEILHDAEDMQNAVAHLPDAAPSARRRALICERMRRTSPADFVAAGC